MNKEFETFHDVEHVPLQVYNRVVTSFNIREDFGPEAVKEYYENFTDVERKQMLYMMAFIKQKGVEAALKMATAGLVIEDSEVNVED